MRKTSLFRLGFAALLAVGSGAFASSADVDLTGRVRMATTSVGYSLQIDVKNDDRHHAAFGPNVYVRVQDRHGNLVTEQWSRQLYQYFGGTATTPNTVNPGQLGYVPIFVSRNAAALAEGQELRVKISGDGSSNFGSQSRKATVCRKGTAGCL